MATLYYGGPCVTEATFSGGRLTDTPEAHDVVCLAAAALAAAGAGSMLSFREPALDYRRGVLRRCNLTWRDRRPPMLLTVRPRSVRHGKHRRRPRICHRPRSG